MASPFTKHTEGAGKTSGSKVVLMVLLGGVLGAAVWYNWSSLAPRAAAAANGGVAPDAVADPAAAIPDNPESIELALAALSQDPTAKLLRGHDDTTAYLDKPPANPFKLSRAWRTQLVKAPTPVAVTPNAPQPRTHTTSFDPTQINLQSIFGSPQKRFALINGKPLGVGAVVAGGRIVSISDKIVVVQPLDDLSSPPVEIPLKH